MIQRGLITGILLIVAMSGTIVTEAARSPGGAWASPVAGATSTLSLPLTADR